VFQHVEGVLSALSGYAGATANTAYYEMVGTNTTGHAESVRVTFDPRVIPTPMQMADKIIMRRVEALIPYARNARTQSDAQVAPRAGTQARHGPGAVHRARAFDASAAPTSSPITSWR
jgi:hypothetical protein